MTPAATHPLRRSADASGSLEVKVARLEGRQDTHEAVCVERHEQNLERHAETKGELKDINSLLRRIGWGVLTAAVTGIGAVAHALLPQILKALGMMP